MATTKAHDLARLLADGVVGTTEIGDSQVTTAKIADASITTDKLATNAVTAAKVDIDAADVPYDNTTSGISANTLQEAIDYLNIATGGGSAGAQATYTRDAFTATAGQTTFTTSNGYTLGYVQVFMNGVMLALTDYTANDESTVVLSTGARADDEIVIIAYDSFAISEVLRVLDISPSSPDDAIELDASGNIRLGASSEVPWTHTVTEGNSAVLRQDGLFGAAAVKTVTGAGFVAYLNRVDTAGGVAGIYSNGDLKGSIGVNGNSFYISNHNGTPDVGLRFNSTGGSVPAVIPCDSSGEIQNNTINLGYASGRFGKVFVEDGIDFPTGNMEYEKGTWTPTVSVGSLGVASGYYIKIGKLVAVTIVLGDFSDRSAGSNVAISLPFASTTTNDNQSHGSVMFRYVSTSGDGITAYINDNGSVVQFYKNSASGNWTAVNHSDLNNSSAYLRATFTYETDS